MLAALVCVRHCGVSSALAKLWCHLSFTCCMLQWIYSRIPVVIAQICCFPWPCLAADHCGEQVIHADIDAALWSQYLQQLTETHDCQPSRCIWTSVCCCRICFRFSVKLQGVQSVMRHRCVDACLSCASMTVQYLQSSTPGCRSSAQSTKVRCTIYKSFPWHSLRLLALHIFIHPYPRASSGILDSSSCCTAFSC